MQSSEIDKLNFTLCLRYRVGKNANTYDSVNIKIAQAESQRDSSFPTGKENHQGDLNKANKMAKDKQKADKQCRTTTIHHNKSTALERSVIINYDGIESIIGREWS